MLFLICDPESYRLLASQTDPREVAIAWAGPPHDLAAQGGHPTNLSQRIFL
jgi:hypothetical protein